MKRLLDHDPLTGVSTYHDYDDQTDTTYIETVQDVAPFLRKNRALRNEPEHRKKGMKADMLHAATIPIGVQYKWIQKYGVNIYDQNHQSAVKKLLNSPDWSYLRTTTGRI